MPRPICAHINLSAMSHNLDVIRRSSASAAPSAGIWAVIKANAYGHGLENAVSGFAQADGLAMLDFEEAKRCRFTGWSKPILMLEGPFDLTDLEQAARDGLSLVIHQTTQIDWLERLPLGCQLDLYLKLETGMNRLGFDPQDYRAAYERLLRLQTVGTVRSITHMTHFAQADQADGLQAPMRTFVQTVRGLAGEWSVSNSAASLMHAPAVDQSAKAADTRHWVRPGICLYGGSPMEHLSSSQLDLRSAMSLRSELISTRYVQAGEGIGYGYLYRATRPMRVGVVACGYADGYPRHAPSGTPASVLGVQVPIVGRVSMDMMMVDITDHPTAQVGSEVVLWGAGGPSADDVARCAGTISYELLSGVTARVPRQVVNQRP